MEVGTRKFTFIYFFCFLLRLARMAEAKSVSATKMSSSSIIGFFRSIRHARPSPTDIVISSSFKILITPLSNGGFLAISQSVVIYLPWLSRRIVSVYLLFSSLIVVINLLNSLGCWISFFRLIVKTTVKMGPSRTNSTSTNPAKKDEGSNHLVECTGPGSDGSGCVIWTNIWVPMLIPKNFFSRHFLCGFCAVEELKKN